MFKRISIWLMVVLATALAGVPSARALPSSATLRARAQHLDSLLTRAAKLELHERAMWKRLLHYRSAVFGGFSSEADAPQFFLAEDGRSDPEAELAATLNAFFSPPPKDVKLEHPICRFPARFMWLDEELGIDRDLLPVRRCKRFDEFVRLIRPTGVSLVFSSYYLNNPASAFGHTFLRVHRAGVDGEKTPDLLDYGVDYSASVDTDNALLYAIKGLLGLFPGDFRKVPYHFKVREYNDFESRDLWEYELELNPAELRRFTAHLWELGSTYFAYYYLSENCSYHVLALLEVAKPEAELLEHVGWPVIPADTVKALYRNPGMVRALNYRPSNRTHFKQRMELLSPDEVQAVSSLMSDPAAKLPAGFGQAQQVKVLDAALDLLDIRTARELVKDRATLVSDDAEVQQRLLERRAEIDVESESPIFAPPFRRAPHVGHGSTRLGLGSGYERQRGYYHALQFRLALHDLVDSAAGYPEHAEIEFLPLTLRYYVESPVLTLEQISAVRVKSLTPIDRFDTSLSFKFDAGMLRTYDSGCLDCPTGFGEVGAGLSIAPFGDALLAYATADARVHLPIAHSGLFDVVRAGVGPSAGLRLRLHRTLAVLAAGEWTYLPAQTPWHVWSGEAKLRWQYAKNFALGAEGRLYPESASVQGTSYLYF